MKNNELKRPAKLEIENAVIRFKNFSGRESQFNPKGRRNFVIFLDEETAEILQKDGWNIKWKKGREEGDPDIPTLQVAVKYGEIPPQIYRISGDSMTLETEDTVGDLDYAEIESADLVINPSLWTVGSKGGIKAYLSKAYITIARSRFDDKYRNVKRSSIDNYIDDEETPFD